MPVLDQNNQQELLRYTAFVRSSPWTVATQDPGWFSVKEGWAGEGVYLENDAGEITAALSIIFKAVAGGRCLAYAPRGPVCDIHDAELVLRLIKEAEPVLQKHRAFVLRIDPEVPYDEALDELYRQRGLLVRNRGFNKHQLIQPRFNMMLDIRGKSWEELMASFSEKTRYNIRLAQRKGVTVRWSHDPADIVLFHEIYKATCVRDKIGARPLEYFTRMLEAYPGDLLRVYVAEHEGEALSAAITLNYGRKMWYLYGASSNEKRNLMPNYAMQAEMIRWALQEKKELYDFGGVFVLDKTNGLYKFKEGFCRKQGVTELVGEYDLVRSTFWYKIFTDVAPRLQDFKRKLKKH